MAIVTPDTNIILRQFITASGTDLYGLIGDRACGLRKKESWTKDQKCIVYALRGGGDDPDQPVQYPNYQLMSYGAGTLEDAMEVDRALADRLHAKNLQAVAAGVIISATRDGLGQGMVDPDTKEVYVVSFYEFEMRGL